MILIDTIVHGIHCRYLISEMNMNISYFPEDFLGFGPPFPKRRGSLEISDIIVRSLFSW